MEASARIVDLILSMGGSYLRGGASEGEGIRLGTNPNSEVGTYSDAGCMYRSARLTQDELGATH